MQQPPRACPVQRARAVIHAVFVADTAAEPLPPITVAVPAIRVDRSK